MMALLAVAAGCQSAPALELDGGVAGRSGSDGAPGVGSDGAPDGGACGDPYASSSMPLALCAVDSDCHSAYLYCGPPQGTVIFCRDADAAIDRCTPRVLVDAPICPDTVQITDHLCGVRYQRPCQVDSDCGPAFTCVAGAASPCAAGSPCGMCQWPPSAVCETKADCPNEWDCYAACACPGTPNAQTTCHPPFAIFHCPECAPTPAL
jgi:hypothetical protein